MIIEDFIIRIRAMTSGVDDTTDQVHDLAAQYMVLSDVAQAAMRTIGGAIQSAIKAHNEYQAALTGLKSIAEGTGNSVESVTRAVNNLTNDGLIPAADASTALKNLLARGFSSDEAVKMLERFKDAAAFGRQGSLSLGEAVRTATEGIKNENSVLVDNAGVTKNVSVMWKEYAASIGKSASDLTMAEKRQAEFAGVMEETKFQVGDAAKLVDSLSGSQSKLDAETTKLAQAYGSALAPAVKGATDIFTQFVQGITGVVTRMPEAAAGVTGFTVVVGGFAIGAGTLKVALNALGISSLTAAGGIGALTKALLGNPISWIALALGVAVGAFASFASAADNAKKSQEEFNEAVKKFEDRKIKGIIEAEIPAIKEENAQLQKLTDAYKKASDERDEYLKSPHGSSGTKRFSTEVDIGPAKYDLQELSKEFNKLGIAVEDAKGNFISFDSANRLAAERIASNNASVSTATSDYAQLASSVKDLARQKVDLNGAKELVNTYKTAAKGSREWLDAEKALSEAYTMHSTASGIKISAIETEISAQELAVKTEYAVQQAKMATAEVELRTSIATQEAALTGTNGINEQIDALKRLMAVQMAAGDFAGYGLAAIELERLRGEQDACKGSIDGLKSSLALLNSVMGVELDQIRGITVAQNGMNATTKAAINELSDLYSAYESLKSGQALNLGQLYDLIRAYPQVAEHIAKTGDVTLKHGEILRMIAQEERKSLIATQEANIKKLESQRGAMAAMVQATVQGYLTMAKAAGEFNSIQGGISAMTGAVQIAMQSAALEDRITKAKNELEALRHVTIGAGGSSKSGGGGKGSSQKDDPLQKEYDEVERLKRVKDLSAKEELRMLDEIGKKYKLNAEQRDEHNYKIHEAQVRYAEQEIKLIERASTLPDMTVNYDAQITELERLRTELQGNADALEKVNSKIADATIKSVENLISGVKDAAKLPMLEVNYQMILDKLTLLLEKYKEFPEAIKLIKDAMKDTAASRIDKVLNLDNDALQASIDETLRNIDLDKRREGLKEPDSVRLFNFFPEREEAALAEIIRMEDEAIARMEKDADNWTEEEKRLYEQRVASRKRHYEQLENLEIDNYRKLTEYAEKKQKEAADRAEKQAKIEEQNAKDALARHKEYLKDMLDASKKYAKDQIALIEKEADARIKAINKQIEALEELDKIQNRRDDDAEYYQKIARLEAQLAYTTDVENRYQIEKQLENERAEFAKRKRKESLEDLKDNLKEQADLVKEYYAAEKEAIDEYMNSDAFAQDSKREAENGGSIIEQKLNAIKASISKDFAAQLAPLEDLMSNAEKLVQAGPATYEAKQSSILTSILSGFENMSNRMSKQMEIYASAFDDLAQAAFRQQPQGSSQPTSQTFNTNQAFYTPTATPYEVRRATRQGLEAATRFA